MPSSVESLHFIEFLLKEGSSADLQVSKLRKLANTFYSTVCASKEFTWMGLFQAMDELRRPRLIVYLEEGPRVVPDEGDKRIIGVSLSESLTPLVLALRPHSFLDLYFRPVSNPSNRIEECLEDIQKRYKTSEQGVLWTKAFVGRREGRDESE